MDEFEVLRRRLRTQRLAGGSFARPEQAVQWLLAVQAQEYGPAKWALGQRSAAGCTDADVERAFADGAILRTHVLRPTWHFVTPADIRWLLALTAPRVHARSALYYRQHGLDERAFARAADVFARGLEGGRACTRKELRGMLAEAGIEADALRASFMLMHAELEQLLCSGPRQGKQQTYMLLDERAPRGCELEREQALAELALRYFSAHGPATLRDLAWWSSLTMGDVRAGLELVKDRLEATAVGDLTYWHAGLGSDGSIADALLLPDYDESFIAYRDLRIRLREPPPEGAPIERPVVVDGETVGRWKRTLDGKRTVVELTPCSSLSKRETAAVEAAVDRYRAFVETPVELRRGA